MFNFATALRAGIVGALMAAPMGVLAADFTMKIGFGTMNDIQHQWANWYKEAIEARAKGRIEVQIFPRAQLGSIASQIEGLQLGTVEAVASPTDFFSGIDPRFGVFSIPALFKHHKQSAQVINDAELNREILTLGADKGLQVVSVYNYATAHYMGKQPMRKLDSDFFSGRWHRATDRQREILLCIACLKNASEEFTVSEIVDKSKVLAKERIENRKHEQGQQQ